MSFQTPGAKSARQQAEPAKYTGTTTASMNPESLLIVQVKRIHEYKRQLLNALYDAVQPIKRRNPTVDILLSDLFRKAAPGYFMAKLIIKLTTRWRTWLTLDPMCVVV